MPVHYIVSLLGRVFLISIIIIIIVILLLLLATKLFGQPRPQNHLKPTIARDENHR